MTTATIDNRQKVEAALITLGESSAKAIAEHTGIRVGHVRIALTEMHNDGAVNKRDLPKGPARWSLPDTDAPFRVVPARVPDAPPAEEAGWEQSPVVTEVVDVLRSKGEASVEEIARAAGINQAGVRAALTLMENHGQASNRKPQIGPVQWRLIDGPRLPVPTLTEDDVAGFRWLNRVVDDNRVDRELHPDAKTLIASTSARCYPCGVTLRMGVNWETNEFDWIDEKYSRVGGPSELANLQPTPWVYLRNLRVQADGAPKSHAVHADIVDLERKLADARSHMHTPAPTTLPPATGLGPLPTHCGCPARLRPTGYQCRDCGEWL